jgi:hypothetical protein
MLSSKFLGGFLARSLGAAASQPQNQLLSVKKNEFLTSVALIHLDSSKWASRHGGKTNGGKLRFDYKILRARPVGPHKKLAPGFKYDGRVGEKANYRYIVHYPEDGKYTIRKLPITKLGGRDPVTGIKVIGRVGVVIYI